MDVNFNNFFDTSNFQQYLYSLHIEGYPSGHYRLRG